MTMRITISFTIDHDLDKDIVDFLDGMSPYKRNQLFRDLLRDHIKDYGDKTVMQSLDELKQMVSNLKIIYQVAPAINPITPMVKLEDDELSELESNLDDIG